MRDFDFLGLELERTYGKWGVEGETGGILKWGGEGPWHNRGMGYKAKE